MTHNLLVNMGDFKVNDIVIYEDDDIYHIGRIRQIVNGEAQVFNLDDRAIYFEQISDLKNPKTLFDTLFTVLEILCPDGRFKLTNNIDTAISNECKHPQYFKLTNLILFCLELRRTDSEQKEPRIEENIFLNALFERFFEGTNMSKTYLLIKWFYKKFALPSTEHIIREMIGLNEDQVHDERVKRRRRRFVDRPALATR